HVAARPELVAAHVLVADDDVLLLIDEDDGVELLHLVPLRVELAQLLAVGDHPSQVDLLGAQDQFGWHGVGPLTPRLRRSAPAQSAARPAGCSPPLTARAWPVKRPCRRRTAPCSSPVAWPAGRRGGCSPRRAAPRWG